MPFIPAKYHLISVFRKALKDDPGLIHDWPKYREKIALAKKTTSREKSRNSV